VYIRVVTFHLDGIAAEEYEQQAAAIAEAFTAWPGLHAKLWLADPERRTFGGVYLFGSKRDADSSRSTPLFQAMVANPNLADLSIEEFDTLPAPTAVTASGLVAAAA
jgi:putative monooxygenase ydhR